MTAEAWSAVADWVVAAAASVAAVTAWKGLNTWKEQAKWNNDAGLAKSILVLLFKHIDAMKNVRFVAIWSEEFEEATKGMDLPTDDRQRRFSEEVAVYNARWRKVQEVRSELYPMIIEGQALWGLPFRDEFSELWKLENELLRAVRLHLEQINPSYDAEIQREFYNVRTKSRDILYLTDESTDSHLADCMRALGPIEDYLRAKLGRKQ
jgi:hypothetical protein